MRVGLAGYTRVGIARSTGQTVSMAGLAVSVYVHEVSVVAGASSAVQSGESLAAQTVGRSIDRAGSASSVASLAVSIGVERGA